MNKGLELLRPNHAGAMVLKDGTTINYGIISINGNTALFYTGKGLQEIWAPDLSPEKKIIAEKLKTKDREELKASGYVQIIPLDQIERVLF